MNLNTNAPVMQQLKSTNLANPLIMTNSDNNSIDQQTRICRRITFLYANDMNNNSNNDSVSSTTNTTNKIDNNNAFQYLRQSNGVPFHQSTHTIHEYTCGGNITSPSNTPKVVATTPMVVSSSVV